MNCSPICYCRHVWWRSHTRGRWTLLVTMDAVKSSGHYSWQPTRSLLPTLRSAIRGKRIGEINSGADLLLWVKSYKIKCYLHPFQTQKCKPWIIRNNIVYYNNGIVWAKYCLSWDFKVWTLVGGCNTILRPSFRRWKLYVPSYLWCLVTRPRGITAQKASISLLSILFMKLSKHWSGSLLSPNSVKQYVKEVDVLNDISRTVLVFVIVCILFLLRSFSSCSLARKIESSQVSRQLRLWRCDNCKNKLRGVFNDKLTVCRMATTYQSYATLCFILVFTKACQWTPFWCKWILSALSRPVTLRSVSVSFSSLPPGFSYGLFSSGFPTKNFVRIFRVLRLL